MVMMIITFMKIIRNLQTDRLQRCLTMSLQLHRSYISEVLWKSTLSDNVVSIWKYPFVDMLNTLSSISLNKTIKNHISTSHWRDFGKYTFENYIFSLH